MDVDLSRIAAFGCQYGSQVPDVAICVRNARMQPCGVEDERFEYAFRAMPFCALARRKKARFAVTWSILTAPFAIRCTTASLRRSGRM